MTARDEILHRVTTALAPLSQRAARPSWDDAALGAPPKGSLETLFAERLTLAHGVLCRTWADVAARLTAERCTVGYCDPGLRRLLPPGFDQAFQIETDFDRARIDDYTFGITRATAAIAETGTLVLSDHETSRRLGALAPWVHVAVVQRETLRATLADMLTAMPHDPNVIWVTGPSKTADVEGILIEGVHGPGVQIALLLD